MKKLVEMLVTAGFTARGLTGLARKSIAALALLMLSVAFAANDAGVVKSVDEFTGAESCSQLVVNSASDFTGIMLSKDETAAIRALFVRSLKGGKDSTYNMFGVLSGDKLYIRFPAADEVREFVPEFVDVEPTDREIAGILVDDSLLNKLLASPSEIRVRFSGRGGSKDFTINHDVILALAAGFGVECL